MILEVNLTQRQLQYLLLLSLSTAWQGTAIAKSWLFWCVSLKRCCHYQFVPGNHELEPQGDGRYFTSAPWGLDNGRQFNSYLARVPVAPLIYQSGGAPLYFSTEVGPVHHVSLANRLWPFKHGSLDVVSAITTHLGLASITYLHFHFLIYFSLLCNLWMILVCLLGTAYAHIPSQHLFRQSREKKKNPCYPCLLSLQITLNNYENFLVGSPQFQWLQNNLNTYVLTLCQGSLQKTSPVSAWFEAIVH